MVMEQFDLDESRPRGVRLPRRERRAQLLAAALEVFVAQGYHAAAMDDIAERAGVSKPVLYQHFPGKLELYLAILDAACDAIIDNCRKALDSTHDNKLRVAATIDAFYAYVGHDTGAFRLVFESDLTNQPAVRGHIDRVTTECADLIATVIEDDTSPAARGVQAAGRLPRGNGAGQRPVLDDRHRRWPGRAHPRPGHHAGVRTGLARHRWLPAHRRADRRLTEP